MGRQAKIHHKPAVGYRVRPDATHPGLGADPTLTINGKPAGVALRPQTYAAVRRRWSAGDKVELDLGIETALVEGNPKIEEVRNQVAVTRGPIVYCLESPDLPPGVRFDEVAISATAKFTPKDDPKLLNGVTVLEGEGRLVHSGEWSGLLYRPLRMSAVERQAASDPLLRMGQPERTLYDCMVAAGPLNLPIMISRRSLF